MVKFRCPKCGHILKADESLIGKHVSCTRCPATLRVPPLEGPTETLPSIPAEGSITELIGPPLGEFPVVADGADLIRHDYRRTRRPQSAAPRVALWALGAVVLAGLALGGWLVFRQAFPKALDSQAATEFKIKTAIFVEESRVTLRMMTEGRYGDAALIRQMNTVDEALVRIPDNIPGKPECQVIKDRARDVSIKLNVARYLGSKTTEADIAAIRKLLSQIEDAASTLH